MGILSNLFGSKRKEITDSDFGVIVQQSRRGEEVHWLIRTNFLAAPIEVDISGDKDGVSSVEKQILQSAIENEDLILTECRTALKDQYHNAELEFESIERHFEISGISVSKNGFTVVFQQKEDPYYFFNVHFKNNRQVGVSIDG